MLDYARAGDKELVSLCKNNDSAALSALTERYIPIAARHASLFQSAQWLEKEDLIQEGMLGFLAAVYAYDEALGATFATFAGKCIKNRIISCVRLTLSKKRIPQKLLLSLEDIDQALSGEESPEEDLISRREAERINALIENELTEKEKTVFRLFAAGLSYEEIAKETSSSKKSIDGALQRIRKKLRSKLS